MSEMKIMQPKVRFKEFAGENAEAWEQRKVGELGNVITGSTPSTSNQAYYSDDGIPWVTPTDISENITFETTKKLSSEGQKVGRVVPKNTILVTCIASIGKNTMLGTVGSFNQQINGLVPNDEQTNPYFLFTESSLWSATMKKFAAAGTMQIVNKKDFSELNTWVPKKAEQDRIGDFFRILDNLITLHQRELDNTKQLKSTMLSKIFPKEGTDVPEFRFAGFTDPWEQCNLGDIVESMYNGQTPSRFNDNNWDGDINWLSSGELNRGVVTETIEKITPAGQKDANLRVVPKGTFVMAITGLEAAGTRGNCAKLAIDTTLNQSCMALFPKRDLLDSDFLFQWYRKVGEEYGIRYTQGTKQQSYNYELIKILPITVPKVDEQRKISVFLDKIDYLITLHQRELETYQTLKQTMLDKMFV